VSSSSEKVGDGDCCTPSEAGKEDDREGNTEADIVADGGCGTPSEVGIEDDPEADTEAVGGCNTRM